MAGLLGALDTANRGMQVTTRGVRTAGHNIANANNPGYSRQIQRTAALTPTRTGAGFVGTGVEQISVERASDAFLQQQLLRQRSQLGSTDVQADALSVVEGVLNGLRSDAA